MIRAISTSDAPKPFSRYSQAVEVAGGARLVFASGQVGVGADGRLPGTEEGEHEQGLGERAGDPQEREPGAA